MDYRKIASRAGGQQASQPAPGMGHVGHGFDSRPLDELGLTSLVERLAIALARANRNA